MLSVNKVLVSNFSEEDRLLTSPPSWLPIDMNVFTRNSVVPGLFKPKPIDKNYKPKGKDNFKHKGAKKWNVKKQQQQQPEQQQQE